MQVDQPHKSESFVKLFVPIFCLVTGILIVGFIFSVYVSSEYEKHNDQIRLINSVGDLTSLFGRNHKEFFSTIEQTEDLMALEGATRSKAVEAMNLLFVNQQKIVLVVTYDGKTVNYFKGYDKPDVVRLIRSLKNDARQETSDRFRQFESFMGAYVFSTTPRGEFLIITSASAGQFKADFVFNKLWPYLIGAVFLSFLISWTTYRFIGNRYNEVLDAQARFGDFAAASSDWFWEMDKNLRFSYFSERFTLVTGVPEDKLLGQTREDNGNPGASAEDWQKHLSDLRSRRIFRNFTHPRIKPDGQQVWLSISGMPYFRDGEFAGYRGVGTDITDRVQTEKMLTEAKDEAEKANRIKSDFLANMSHELRTPLNAVIGFSQMMMGEIYGKLGAPKYHEYAGDICNSARHLLELINDILDISKIESGEFYLNEQDIDVQQVIDEAVGLVQSQIKSKKQKLVVNIEPDMPHLYADRRMVKQVLLNVLSNANKFTAIGGTLSLEARHSGDQGIRFRMNDNGIGISMADLPRVLEPFNQVKTSASVAQEGTGLGLSLVKMLMELHNGKMSIESELDKGTTVQLVFPKQRSVPAVWLTERANAGAADKVNTPER